MTWGEFKAAVEAAGVEDSEKIAWIDWSGIGLFVKVNRCPYSGVQITDDEMAEFDLQGVANA